MNATERSIFEQFPFWREAGLPNPVHAGWETYVIIGCGTSYNLALSIAATFNLRGLPAIAVPAGEWLLRPEAYLSKRDPMAVRVVALSRSGESTETVAAAAASRQRGHHVTGITCESGSSLTRNADTVLFARTHPEEGIVMTASASLMLIVGFALAGVMAGNVSHPAEALLKDFAARDLSELKDRSHFVFLGGGASYGVAVEGSLKLQEMSLSYTQAFHPGEYRHGPVSLVDEHTAVVMLYNADTFAEEEKLVSELVDKGAVVLGFGGPGTASFDVGGDHILRPVTVLPALQWLGEIVARNKGIDTLAPRHLTKVVRLS